MTYRPIPPFHGACPACDRVMRVSPGKSWGRVTWPAAMFVHGPRAARCPGSRQRPRPWLEASGLPRWEQMSSLDQGAALLHVWKRLREGARYAIDNYPAEYFDDPELVGLDRETACRHAAITAGPWQEAVRRLGWDDVEQLYTAALGAERRRDHEAAVAARLPDDPAASAQVLAGSASDVELSL
jgi:hypothetical protein